MPTVIDSLVVTLGLDAKQFNEEQKQAVRHLQGLEEATRKHGGQATRGVNEMVGAFKELQGRLLAIGAIIAAGLGFNRLTQDVTQAANELGRLSKQLGISAQDLDAWEKVGKTVGLAAGEMAGALGSVNAQLQEFHSTGRSELAALMGRDKASGGLDIGPMQTTDTAASIMMRLSEWYKSQQGEGKGSQASHLLQTRGGLSRGAISLLELGPEEIKKRLDQAKRIAPTDEEINKFKELTKAFGDVMNVIERLTQQALLPFITTMTRILNMLTEWLTKWATSNQSPPAAAGEALGKMGMPELAPKAGKPGLFQRGWNWMMGRPNGDSGEAGGGGGAGSGSAPGAAPGGAQPSSPGAPGPGASFTPNGTLLEQRQRFARELEANPELKDKVMRIMANEQGKNGQGTQAIAESMMNRALVRGTNLEKQARWAQSENGYYDQGNMGRGALENPAHRAILERGLNNALGGSNIAEYASDNASSWLAEKHKGNGNFRYIKGFNGESFFAPGRAEPGRAKAWDNWYKGVRDTEGSRSNAAPATPGITGAQRTFENWRGLGLGKGAAMRGGDTNSTTNSNTMSIGSMHVTVPPGSDPSAYADGITRRLGDYNNVASSNTGLE